MSYRGEVIEESLTDKSVLKDVHIVSTRNEKVTAKHKTPWLKQWTLHLIEVPEAEAAALAERLSHCLEANHWYIDYKNETTHFIIFPGKVFKVSRAHPEENRPVIEHALKLNIPSYQLPFDT